jgi:preprotein translocase subunit SecG
VDIDEGRKIMSKKRIVISLYVLAFCMLGLNLIFASIEDSARGVSTSTGYINSEGKIVITNSGYSGQNAEGMREANAIKNICNVMMWVFVVLGTLCLIFMHNAENTAGYSSNKKNKMDL